MLWKVLSKNMEHPNILFQIRPVFSPEMLGFDRLTMLCEEFECWYNSWRPHMALDGIRPDDVYYNNKLDKPKRDAKTVPCNIEQHFFRETRIVGYQLKNVA